MIFRLNATHLKELKNNLGGIGKKRFLNFTMTQIALIAMIGYVLRKLEFQLAPLVVGVVLGPLIEKHLREGLFMSLGDVSVFYTSPIAIGIWSVVILVLLLEPLRALYGKIFGVKVKKLIPESSE